MKLHMLYNPSGGADYTSGAFIGYDEGNNRRFVVDEADFGAIFWGPKSKLLTREAHEKAKAFANDLVSAYNTWRAT